MVGLTVAVPTHSRGDQTPFQSLRRSPGCGMRFFFSAIGRLFTDAVGATAKSKRTTGLSAIASDKPSRIRRNMKDGSDPVWL
jgi:hypothetical protein